MKLLFLLLFQIIFIYGCGSNTPDPADPEDLFDEYRQVKIKESGSFVQFLERIKEHYNIPGIAAALVSKDSILNSGVAGVRKAGELDKIDIDDIFSIGSCA